MQTAILKVEGAHCASCAYAIEHAGRRVSGVEDVRVDIARHEIRIEYNGVAETLTRFQEVVRTIGCEMAIVDGAGSEA